MIQTTKLKPAKKFGAGYFISEQMELRQWTIDDLARESGYTKKYISQVLFDIKPLSKKMAQKLGKIFNTSSKYWQNLGST